MHAVIQHIGYSEVQSQGSCEDKCPEGTKEPFDNFKRAGYRQPYVQPNSRSPGDPTPAGWTPDLRGSSWGEKYMQSYNRTGLLISISIFPEGISAPRALRNMPFGKFKTAGYRQPYAQPNSRCPSGPSPSGWRPYAPGSSTGMKCMQSYNIMGPLKFDIKVPVGISVFRALRNRGWVTGSHMRNRSVRPQVRHWPAGWTPYATGSSGV